MFVHSFTLSFMCYSSNIDFEETSVTKSVTFFSVVSICFSFIWGILYFAYRTLLFFFFFYTAVYATLSHTQSHCYANTPSRASQDTFQSYFPRARLSAVLTSRLYNAVCKVPPPLVLLELEECYHLLGTDHNLFGSFTKISNALSLA